MKSLAIFLFIFSGHLAGQIKTNFPISVYSVNDGLAQSVVYTLFQDKKGYLWLGTQAGVSRYDGSKFTNYNTIHGLTHNTVRHIFQTRTGEIIFSTERGVTVYDGDTFKPLPITSGPKPTSVRMMLEAQDGSLWGASYQDGVFQYRDGHVTFFGAEEGIPDFRARAILQDQKGRIWVGFFGQGIAVLDNDRWQTVPTEPVHRNARVLREAADGNIFLGTNNGLFLIWSDFKVERFSENPLLQRTITSIVPGPDGSLWLGTNQFGAIRLKEDQAEIFDIQNGMSNNGIQSILVDNEKKLWFGTYGGGVCRLGRTQFFNITSQPGFNYDNVYALFQDQDGGIWLGTNGGGLTYFNQDELARYTMEDGLLDNKILSINQDSGGRIWIGTLQGVNYLENGAFKSLTTEQGLPGNITYFICPLSDGRIMFATMEGLGILQDGTLTAITREDGLSHNRIHHILERRNGEIWLATLHGISVFAEGKIVKTFSIADGMLSDSLNNLFEDSKGQLWIASSEGLMRMDGQRFVGYTTNEGLSNPLCNVVIEDQEGLIWVGTANGLNRFDGENFALFTHHDGIPSNEINRNAGIRDRDGNLWFGTPSGATKFRSADPAGALPPPYVNITSLQVLGQDWPIPLDRPLSASENFIEVHFDGISFTDAENIRFAYRLEGLDDQWITTNSNHAVFLNLPAGEYLFSVRARNSSGIWSEKPATLQFSVEPPFWREPWFIPLVALLILSLILFDFNRLRRQNVKLENMVNARTQELKQLALWDHLTGAHNRHYLDIVMPSELAKLKRHFYATSRGEVSNSKSLGLAMVDIDHFKTINDTFGHEIGDLALCELAARLKTFIRDSDILVRWGGEEFLMILPQIDYDHLAELCARLCRHIGEGKIELPSNKSLILNISIGFTIFPLDHDPMDYEWRKLVNLADIALYEAKKEGRNRVVGFNPEGYLLEALFKMAEKRAEGIPDYMVQGFTNHPHPEPREP